MPQLNQKSRKYSLNNLSLTSTVAKAVIQCKAILEEGIKLLEKT